MKAKRILASILSLAMVLGSISLTALADDAVNVAKIGDEGYASLEAAVSKAKSGDTIELLSNATDVGTLLITDGVTFEGNSNTISGKSAIHMSGTSTVQNTNFKDTSSNAIWSEASGIDITITGCSFENVGWDAILISGTHADGDRVTITNNVFKGTSTAGRYIHIQPSGRPKMEITVTKNKMYNTEDITAIGAWFTHADSTLDLAENYMAVPEAVSVTVYNDEGKHTNISEAVIPYYADDTMTTLAEEPCVKVMSDIYNSTYYTSLAEAVAEAEQDNTIVLLRDAELDTTLKINGVTLDGQGHSITPSDNYTSGKTVFIYRDYRDVLNGDLTLKNVTIDAESIAGQAIRNDNGGGTFYMDNVTVTGGKLSYASGVHISGGASTAVITNCTFTENKGDTAIKDLGTDSNYGYANDLWVGGNTTVTVDNSTIGSIFVNDTGAGAPGHLTINETEEGKTNITYLATEVTVSETATTKSTAVITGGTIDTLCNKGILEISGGTFNTELQADWCADGFEPTENEDGTYGVSLSLPTADVTDIPETELEEKNAPDLTFALKFTAVEPTEAQLEKYKDWYADFELTVNKKATFNAYGNADGYLAGEYGTYGWISVPFDDVTLEAGDSLKIMEYAASLMGEPGLKITYNDVVEFVKIFNCGIYFTDEFIAENPDLEVTLSLNMYNPEDETEKYTIGDTYKFSPVTCEWIAVTDSGYYMNGTNKEGLMRWLFLASINGTADAVGIEYQGSTQNTQVLCDTVITDGDVVFYGDVNGFTETEATKDTYSARGFVKSGSTTNYSDIVTNAPNWDRELDYKGGNE